MYYVPVLRRLEAGAAASSLPAASSLRVREALEEEDWEELELDELLDELDACCCSAF